MTSSTTNSRQTVRLGYEVGTGSEVTIPVRHTVVTGQSQEAGKTTTLEALIERAGLRAITFVTKRGEGSFKNARRMNPYFREQADWQFVASVLEASRGERMKFERAWIMKASKGAKTLADVHANVKRLGAEAALKKRSMDADLFMQLEAYLDVVVPEIARVKWADRIVLSDGVNAMDLTALSSDLQHLVIRSALDWVMEFEMNTILVVPEAWKFIPEGRGTPVKLVAESFIRQSAGLGNYLWLDSQDIAGVDKKLLKQVPVWILGVQRERNEIKTTLDSIPASVKKPKAADIATLDLGQFYACWKTHAIKTYVQPAWMNDAQAMQVATGNLTTDMATRLSQSTEEPTVKESEARELLATNERLERENADLRRRLDALESKAPSSNDRPETRTPVRTPEKGDTGSTPVGVIADEDELYRRFRDRLVQDAPALLRVVTSRPGIEVEVTREVIRVDGKSTRGRIARLIVEGFIPSGKATTTAVIQAELGKRGETPSNIELGLEMKALVEMGFFTRDNKWFTLVDGAEVNVVER